MCIDAETHTYNNRFDEEKHTELTKTRVKRKGSEMRDAQFDRGEKRGEPASTPIERALHFEKVEKNEQRERAEVGKETYVPLSQEKVHRLLFLVVNFGGDNFRCSSFVDSCTRLVRTEGRPGWDYH